MAWGSDILGIKACFDPSGGNIGGCPTSMVAHAINAARGLDARVINLSLWTTTEVYTTTPTPHCAPPVLDVTQDDQAIQDAVENASTSALIVVAAGNYAGDELLETHPSFQNTCKTYPAGHPKALAVGAVQRNTLNPAILEIKDKQER